MSEAKRLINDNVVTATMEAEEIVDSVVLNGINGSNVTIVDTIVNGMPESVQQNVAVQTLVAQIHTLERHYAPLVRDYQYSQVLANPERYVFGLAILLFAAGLIMNVVDSFGLGYIASWVILVGIIAVIAFQMVVRFRVQRGLKTEVEQTRSELISKIGELNRLQLKLSAKA